MFKQKEETQPMLLNITGRKRIRERFRATLAGLLELEVLKARHKEMVETALGKTEEEASHGTKIQEQLYQCLLDKDSLRLRRSFSEEAIHDTRKERGLWSCSSHSSEDLLYCQCFKERSQHHQELHTYTQLQSRASSGFCDSDFGDGFTPSDDTVSSLSTSMASLRSKYSSGELEYFMSETTPRNLPIIFQNNKQHRRRSHADLLSHFSDDMIPEDGFLSVADLYPDSHWPVVSEILQFKVVLQPTYRTDLPGHQGMEVYRYPSPLHAVALQSPLYAPHSPQNNRKKNERHFSRRDHFPFQIKCCIDCSCDGSTLRHSRGERK
ncbi:Dapper -like protein 1 [Triplophysa tibetana]|uniref:Dapper-like protein 1 n=1 Tax=Triplophysa tibetana TaxID=1572043 RepID=A0A5A9N6M4_9TELE|nr:Dapper -like protein 1 [Triplophysa tibetana]